MYKFLLLCISTYPFTKYTMPFRLVFFFNLKTIFPGGYPGGLARSWSATTKDSRGPRSPSQVAPFAEQSQDDLLFLGLAWKIKANQCLSTLVNIMLEYVFLCNRWSCAGDSCPIHFD